MICQNLSDRPMRVGLQPDASEDDTEAASSRQAFSCTGSWWNEH